MLPLERGRGFDRLPRPDPADVFFDMEGDPLFEEGLENVLRRHRLLAEAVRHQTNLRRMQESAAFPELPIERIVQSSHEHLAILVAAEGGDVVAFGKEAEG